MMGLSFNELNQVKKEGNCERHNTQMIAVSGKKPFCPECVKERIDQTEQEIVKRAAMKEQRKAQSFLLNFSMVPDETLLDATFDNFQETQEEEVRNKRLARAIAGEYLKGKVYNTILTGKPGTGKSHLAMSMLKALNEFSDPQMKCLFVSADEALRRIKGSFSNKQSRFTEEYVVDLLSEPDILVLDDVGAESGNIGTEKAASDFVSRVLYAVMNARQKKITIITTNLSSDGMSEIYDHKLISRLSRGAENHIIKFSKTNDKRQSIVF